MMIDILKRLLFGAPEPAETEGSLKPRPVRRPTSKQFGGFTGPLPEQPAPKAPVTAFKRDLEYENSPGVREALEAIDAASPAVLVSGRAGTGKTTLIRYLLRRPGGETTAVVAPTAVAALNAGAQTIHSFFRLPPQLLDARNLEPGKNFGQLYRRMTRLIVDEISMVRADLLDAVNARLKEIRGNSAPFGGVQLVMVGDFLQLPPVVTRQDRPLLHALEYKTPFAFNAHSLETLPVEPVALEHVYRQEEKEFIDVLNRVRIGEGDQEVADFLNSRCLGEHRNNFEPLKLTPTRAAADRYNQAGLAALTGNLTIYDAAIEGKLDVAHDKLPVPERLELRLGARVMAAKNDLSSRWINGSLGTVTNFNKNGVWVKFDSSKEEHLVERASWEKIKQVWNAKEDRIENEVVGKYVQVPLIHAWALTIHKAQGLTLDDVRLDLGSGAFAPGQVYVALSRVRTLAGLSLAKPLRAADLKADPMLLAFVEWMHSRTE